MKKEATKPEAPPKEYMRKNRIFKIDYQTGRDGERKIPDSVNVLDYDANSAIERATRYVEGELQEENFELLGAALLASADII